MKQANAAKEFLYKLRPKFHYLDEMLDWVLKGTEVGATAAKKNAWSARSFVPKAAELTALTGTTLTFSVRVEERGSPSPTLSA